MRSALSRWIEDWRIARSIFCEKGRDWESDSLEAGLRDAYPGLCVTLRKALCNLRSDKASGASVFIEFAVSLMHSSDMRVDEIEAFSAKGKQALRHYALKSKDMMDQAGPKRQLLHHQLERAKALSMIGALRGDNVRACQSKAVAAPGPSATQLPQIANNSSSKSKSKSSKSRSPGSGSPKGVARESDDIDIITNKEPADSAKEAQGPRGDAVSQEQELEPPALTAKKGKRADAAFFKSSVGKKRSAPPKKASDEENPGKRAKRRSTNSNSKAVSFKEAEPAKEPLQAPRKGRLSLRSTMGKKEKALRRSHQSARDARYRSW